ncbi:UNVERIFIED_ORG: radical SAM protein [Clostridium botulinum]
MNTNFYKKIRAQFLEETNFKLKQIFVYSTTRCNSRCKTCNIYKKEDESLSLEAIKSIIDFASKRNDCIIYFEGGEFFLHPEYEKILEMAKNIEYCIISNGQFTKKIEDAIAKYGIKRIAFSLDGPRDTYKNVRGIDGFENLMNTIEAIKDKTEIHIDSTINPWNTYEDIKWVREFCNKNNFKHAIQPMYPINFFDNGNEDVSEYLFDISDLLQNSSFIRNTSNYFEGKIYLPCLNVRETILVYPNGDVPLCHMRDETILGNLNESTLDDIMLKTEIIENQEQSLKCNKCWLNCQRIIDVKLFEFMEKKYTHAQLEKEFGNYKWPL